MRAAAAQIEIDEDSDGYRYEGQVNQRRIRHGQGVASYPDGERYEGEFRNSWCHGHGTMTYPNGRVESGQWENGGFQRLRPLRRLRVARYVPIKCAIKGREGS